MFMLFVKTYIEINEWLVNGSTEFVGEKFIYSGFSSILISFAISKAKSYPNLSPYPLLIYSMSRVNARASRESITCATV